jgi:putative nucleotidyltransferase with HDIG domain
MTTARAAYNPFGGFSRGLNKLRPRLRLAWGGLEAYAVAVALTTVGFVALLVHVGAAFDAPIWALAVLGLIALLAERQPVRVTANLEMTVSVLPTIFAAVVYGPLEAMTVVAIGLLGDLRRPLLRWIIWTSYRSLGAGLGGAAAMSVVSDRTSIVGLFAAVATAAVVEATVDAGFGAVTVSIRGTGSFAVFLHAMGRILVGTVPLYTPVITLLAYVYYEVSPWTLLLFLAPAFAAQSLYRLYRQERNATEELKETNARLERANLSFASALVSALDARDSYTAGHSAVVAVYARDIAARVGLTEKEQQLAHLCGLLHDIGKVGLPPSILEKRGALTLDERRQMEAHATIGERILANVDGYKEIARIVRHHHERMDGNGYPDGLCGRDIPIISRIIAVADAYSAMTSGRPYRDAMPTRVARIRLAQAAESQFDTSVVAAFEAILTAASDTYSSGARADFAVEAQRQPALTARVAATAA